MGPRATRADLKSFRSYLNWRADIKTLLTPLMGRTLLCDCKLGASCHGPLLVEACSGVFSVPARCNADAPVQSGAASSVEARSSAAHRKVFVRTGPSDPAPVPACDAAGLAARPARKLRPPAENLAKVNESLRSRRARIHRAPGWCPMWRVFV